MNENYFAVLMAGGIGSRFWPVSTSGHPKQFRDLLNSGETLIQTTFRRLKDIVPLENIYILTNQRYHKLVTEQLPEVTSDQVVMESAMRNTAPAVLMAALKIQKRNPDGIMLMAPSDHWIEDNEAFKKDIELAFSSCSEEEKIITLGIRPTFPNTGYGYIAYRQDDEELVKAVQQFTEKPSIEVAREFLDQGNYLWNAGIFVWNVGYIISAFRQFLPEMLELFEQGIPVLNTASEREFIRLQYPLAANVSIDYGILEKDQNIHVIAASFDWNDLGTWGSLYEETPKDPDNNAVLNARLMAKDATGNIISSDRNRIVVVEGLQDYIIVDESEVLLLVPKDREQDIKQIRLRVEETFGNNLD